jgi:hypothetical protein
VVTGVPSHGGKRPGREAGHLPPSTAKIKNAWSYIASIPVSLRDVEDFFTFVHKRKELVKYYVWSVALYGAETWTLRKVDQK